VSHLRTSGRAVCDGDCVCNCNPDVRKWDTSALEDAESMFTGLVLFDRDLSKWDTRSLTNANGMFDGCPITESHKPRMGPS
jgi:hypothetical protein